MKSDFAQIVFFYKSKDIKQYKLGNVNASKKAIWRVSLLWVEGGKIIPK